MNRRRSFAFVALLTAVLGACQATPAPNRSPSPSAAATGSPIATTAATIVTGCAALHWYDVRSALEATPHYTYRTVDHIVDELPAAGSAPPPPVVLDRVAVGAYVGPDRTRETSTWTPVAAPPSGAPFRGLAPLKYPDFIQIGTRGWERVPLADPLWHPGRRTPDALGGHVPTILGSLAAVAPWSRGQPDPANPTGCVFTDTSVQDPDGAQLEAALWADSVTALPTRLRIDRVGKSRGQSHFDMAIDTTAEAPIEPPAADEVVSSPSP